MVSREKEAAWYKDWRLWLALVTVVLMIPGAYYYMSQVTQVSVVEIFVTNTENDTFEIPLPALGLRIHLLINNRTPRNMLIDVFCNDTDRAAPIYSHEIDAGRNWNFTHEVQFNPRPMSTMYLLFVVRDSGSRQQLTLRLVKIVFVPWTHAAKLSSYNVSAGKPLTRTVLFENHGVKGDFMIVREVWRIVNLGTTTNPTSFVEKYYNETMIREVRSGQTYIFTDTFQIYEPGLYMVRTFVSKMLAYKDDIILPCPRDCGLYWQLSDGSSNLLVWVS